MRKLLTTLAASVAAALSVGGSSVVRSAPILQIERGGHAGTIWGVAVDGAGKFLVTASSDRTARVWRLSDLSLVRILRPPLDGPSGALFAAAMTPDGATVIVGGNDSPSGGQSGCLWYFDRLSGRLIRRTPTIPGVVVTLAMSRDGRRVAAGYTNGDLRVYSVSDGAALFADNLADWVYGLDFDATGRLFAGSIDGIMRLYDPAGTVLVKKRTGAWIKRAAFSPDGKHIAIGSGVFLAHTLRSATLEDEGSLIYAPTTGNGGGVEEVAWSRDGKSVYGGGAAICTNRWTDGKPPRYDEVRFTGGLVLALAALPQGGVAYAGESGFGTVESGHICTGPANAQWRQGAIRVAPGGDCVVVDSVGNGTPAFSLADRKLALTRPADFGSFVSPREHSAALLVENWRNNAKPRVGGRVLPLGAFEESRCLTILPDDTGFLLGCDNSLRAYDVTGRLRWRKGSFERVQSVVVRADGRVALAAYRDGTVRWYRTEDGAELLSLFVDLRNDRWVLWTPTGYYDCSPGGEGLFGWAVSNGSDRATDFYSAARFRSAYYRPDVVARILGTLSEDKAVSLADAESGREYHAKPADVALPPIVRIVGEEEQTYAGILHLRFVVRTPTGEPITKLLFLVDGRPVGARAGLSIVAKDELAQTESISMTGRDANVSVIAFNRNGAGEPATIRAKCATPSRLAARKPNLYVLAVGVCVYSDPQFGGDKHPTTAAEQLAAAFRRQQGTVFAAVEAKLLPDSKATRAGILDGLDWLQQSVKRGDVAVIYLCGRGGNDRTGDFIFLPTDSRHDHVRATGMNLAEIEDIAGTLSGQPILLLDGHLVNLGGLPDQNVASRLASPESGVIVISANKAPNEVERISPQGLDAFTQALIEGLNGRAALPGNPFVSFIEWFDYVRDSVLRQTDHQEFPFLAMPPGIPNFPIAGAGEKTP